MEGNFSAPLEWRNFGREHSIETRNKISDTLKGQPFTEERKRNISKGTKKVNYKWAKTCKHGICPLHECLECSKEAHREAVRKFRNKKND
jgi:hypothetical protein